MVLRGLICDELRAMIMDTIMTYTVDSVQKCVS